MMTNNKKLKHFRKKIIIGGLPRSGSTLLRFILDASDHIVSGPETGFFLRPLSDSQARLDKIAFKIADKLELDQDTVKSLIMTSRNSIQAFDLMMYYYLDSDETQVIAWAEKTPRNCFHYDRLAQEDENLYFISTVRNGLDVVTSEFEVDDKRAKDRMYWVTIQQYVDCMRSIYSFSNQNHFVLKYESLCSNPQATMKKIFDFIGIKFSDNCLSDFNKFSKTRNLTKVSQPKLVYPIQTRWIERWKESKYKDIVAKFLSNKDAVFFYEKSGYTVT